MLIESMGNSGILLLIKHKVWSCPAKMLKMKRKIEKPSKYVDVPVISFCNTKIYYLMFSSKVYSGCGMDIWVSDVTLVKDIRTVFE